MVKHIVAWDLGATKCTAGLVTYDEQSHALVCQKKMTLKLTAAESLEDLVRQIELGLQTPFSQADAICIGAAGHFDGEMLIHAGMYPFTMHFAKIAEEQHWPPFAVIHDYASIICATFTSYMSDPNNIKRLNTCPMNLHGRRVAFGLGTGLGLKDGVLLPNGDFWFGKNEIGHIGVTAPPVAETHHHKIHHEFIQFMKQEYHMQSEQPLTFEKILSGLGTARLYQFFYPSQRDITPEAVGMKMRSGAPREMLDAFAWYIGLFVGTVQLIFMPEGGVWITGGVALNHLDVFDRPDFHAGIHCSPAYRMQREEYPLGVLSNHEHALLGSGYYAVKRLLSSS